MNEMAPLVNKQFWDWLQIDYVGRKKFLDEQNIEQTLIDQEKERIVPKEEHTALIEHLVPKTQYTFNISAFFGHSWGPISRLKVETRVEGMSTCV